MPGPLQWYSGGASGGAGGGSANFLDSGNDYADSDVLCDILAENAPRGAADSAKLLIAIFIILIGAVEIFSPYTAWYLSYGWRYKGAEPSDAALLFGRVGGVGVVILGVAALFL